MNEYSLRSKGPVNPIMFIPTRAKRWAMQLARAPGGRNSGDWTKWQVAGKRMNGFEFSLYAQDYAKQMKKRDAASKCRQCGRQSFVGVLNGQCNDKSKCKP